LLLPPLVCFPAVVDFEATSTVAFFPSSVCVSCHFHHLLHCAATMMMLTCLVVAGDLLFFLTLFSMAAVTRSLLYTTVLSMLTAPPLLNLAFTPNAGSCKL